jgi:hypothetical protein
VLLLCLRRRINVAGMNEASIPVFVRALKAVLIPARL